MADKGFAADELDAAWPALSVEERVEGFELLHRDDAEKFFLQLSARDQAHPRRQPLAARGESSRRFFSD